MGKKSMQPITAWIKTHPFKDTQRLTKWDYSKPWYLICNQLHSNAVFSSEAAELADLLIWVARKRSDAWEMFQFVFRGRKCALIHIWENAVKPQRHRWNPEWHKNASSEQFKHGVSLLGLQDVISSNLFTSGRPWDSC